MDLEAWVGAWTTDSTMTPCAASYCVVMNKLMCQIGDSRRAHLFLNSETVADRLAASVLSDGMCAVVRRIVLGDPKEMVKEILKAFPERFDRFRTLFSWL